MLSLALSAPQLGWQRLGERTSDALWPWAERLQPAIAWLRAAGYLVQAGSGGGSVRPPTPSGGRWHPTQVARVRARLAS